MHKRIIHGLSSRRQSTKQGFTIVELLVVIIVISVITVLTMFIYNGIQKKVLDLSVKTDIDRLNSLELKYKSEHGSAGKPYYSGDGVDSDLNFTPKTDNIFDVVTNGTDYCIRGYNINGTDSTIDNALTRESTPGACNVIPHSIAANGQPIVPSAPSMTVILNGSLVQATINQVACINGTPQYAINSRINDGSWSGFSDWSAITLTSQLASEGVKYGYESEARCYISDTSFSDPIVGLEATYSHPVNQPSNPSIAIGLNSGNVLATITPISCTAGTPQYGIDSRTNNGSWLGYSSWSTDISSSQAIIEGVKFGYRAQARCYISDSLYSPTAIGNENTYIQPIATIPSSPTLSASAINYSTSTYSWNTPSCPSGLTVRYRYDFTTSYGYDSGWVSYASTSANFTTSTFAQTYTLNTQAQCYSAYASGSWSGSGSVGYYRPTPTVQILVVAGGGGGGNNNGGGGGAGGVSYNASVSVSTGSYGVTIGGGGGAGGAGGGGSALGISVSGGGSGGCGECNGGGGGSGGGGGGCRSGRSYPGGAGTSGQGYAGGTGVYASGGYAGAGGGGAAGTGGNGGPGTGASGGYYTITGSGVYYGGGGGGGGDATSGGGGAGGGGTGRSGSGQGGYAATANTGGGGGGGSGSNGTGGGGGSGVVIIRYNTISLGATGGTESISGSDTIRRFTGSGTFQVY